MLENMEFIYPQNWTQGARKVCLKKQNEKWQGDGNEKRENIQHIIWREGMAEETEKLSEYPGSTGVNWAQGSRDHCWVPN